MPGWTRKRRLTTEQAFYDFLSEVRIDSKDSGPETVLGDVIFDGQRRFITTVFDALENDIHNVYVLKSRQLGLSTITRAFTTFWHGITDGVRGAVLMDTDPNKQEARNEIVSVIGQLPARLKFPRIVRDNRNGLALASRSTMTFLYAGTRETRSNKGLGASMGFSYVHASEMCNYGNEQGLETFRHSLSDRNPSRLYIWESTGRGYNQWHTMWQEALLDPGSATLFLGWWSKETQRISENDASFARYGTAPPTEEEIERMADVEHRYGHKIDREQLAWIRRRMAPGDDGSSDDNYSNVGRLAEQAWTEDDAFQMTGSSFFEPLDLTRMAAAAVSERFSGYSFRGGIEFADCKLNAAFNPKQVDLKVWRPPVEGSSYVVAADVAFGSNPNNDRSACHVLRAYADGLDQEAEFCSPLVNTQQYAWLIATLCGWYGAGASEVFLICELNGPGEAVWRELGELKNRLRYAPAADSGDDSVRNVFKNVRNFLYSRADAVSPSRSAYHWKTTPMNKVPLMERLRDFGSNGGLNLRSMEAIDELRSLTREGDSIAAEGRKHDDRAVSLAMGIRCWEERVRRPLMQRNCTRETELARSQLDIASQAVLFNRAMLEASFAQKQAERRDGYMAQLRSSWRRR